MHIKANKTYLEYMGHVIVFLLQGITNVRIKNLYTPS